MFIASLLSMCTRFMPGRGLEDEEVYAEYARSEVSHRAFEAPSLSIAQSLVILSFYEWGAGHPYKSWMYIGIDYVFAPLHQSIVLLLCVANCY